MQRIDEGRRGDDRRAMLVIMEDGNVHEFAQALFDHETFRRLDVLQIDAAKGRPEITDGTDKFIDILGINFKVD